LINSFDFADELDGTWSREQLLEMDGRFTAAVERAFGLGLESRAAASATVRIGFRNGKDAAVEGAIEAGGRERCRNKGDISFLKSYSSCASGVRISIKHASDPASIGGFGSAAAWGGDD